MVVRPQGFLKNQAAWSILFGLQIIPNLVRPGGDPLRGGPSCTTVTGALGAKADFDSAPSPQESTGSLLRLLLSAQRIRTIPLAAASSH